MLILRWYRTPKKQPINKSLIQYKLSKCCEILLTIIQSKFEILKPAALYLWQEKFPVTAHKLHKFMWDHPKIIFKAVLLNAVLYFLAVCQAPNRRTGSRNSLEKKYFKCGKMNFSAITLRSRVVLHDLILKNYVLLKWNGVTSNTCSVSQFIRIKTDREIQKSKLLRNHRSYLPTSRVLNELNFMSQLWWCFA